MERRGDEPGDRAPDLRDGDRLDDPRDKGPPNIYGEEFDGILRPLVFVPGMFGTTIKLADNTRTLWPPLYVSQGEFRIKANLRALYDSTVPKQIGQAVPVVYAALEQHLESLRGEVNFFPFWYDWTQSNAVTGAQLAAEIARILSLPRYLGRFDQVDLVCHSMGGLVTRAASILNGAGPRIRRTAYLASPHWGAPKAYFVLHPEVSWELIEDWIIGFLAERAWDRFRERDEEEDLTPAICELCRNIPSTWELLPDRWYFEKKVVVTETRLTGPDPIEGWQATYTAARCAFPQPQHGRVRDAMRFKEQLGGTLPGAPQNILVVASGNQETEDIIEYDVGLVVNGFEDPEASSPSNGDGTVPFLSASLDRTAPNLYGVNGEHVALVNDRRVLDKLTVFLQSPPE